MGSCVGCGECCEVVALPRGGQERRAANLERDWQNGYAGDVDALWHVFDLTQVTEEQARQINPRIVDVMGERDFFTCANYNAETRHCAVHGTDRKPRCCTGFPWYDRSPEFDALRVWPGCSFQVDIEALQLHITRGEN